MIPVARMDHARHITFCKKYVLSFEIATPGLQRNTASISVTTYPYGDSLQNDRQPLSAKNDFSSKAFKTTPCLFEIKIKYCFVNMSEFLYI